MMPHLAIKGSRVAMAWPYPAPEKGRKGDDETTAVPELFALLFLLLC